MSLKLINHQARLLVGLPNLVLVLLGEVLVVGVCDDCGDAVEVYRLFEVLLVSSDPMLRGEDLLVRGGGGVQDVRVEELLLVGAASVQRVVFCEPLHFFLVDDESKAAGLPDVSAGFKDRRDHCDCNDKFINWPVLGQSCDLWEGGCFESGFEHCVNGGGTCFPRGERVVGLRHALKEFVTTVRQWAYIDDLITWLIIYGSYG